MTLKQNYFLKYFKMINLFFKNILKAVNYTLLYFFKKKYLMVYCLWLSYFQMNLGEKI